MRTTIIIREELLRRAMELTNIREKTALIHAGLEALISRAARQRLADLGGQDKTAQKSRRRKAG